MNAKNTLCMDPGWNFFATPLYQKYRKLVHLRTGEPEQVCSQEELNMLRDRKFRDQGTLRVVIINLGPSSTILASYLNRKTDSGLFYFAYP